MERSLFLFLALVGYAVSGMLALADAGDVAAVVLGVASVPLLIWIIALGVELGIRDARSSRDEVTDTRDAAERWRKARYGED